MTIPEAVSGLTKGDFSATELLEACLDRIESTDAQLKAWTYIDYDGARLAAKESKDGPLAGIPVGIKDIFDVAGMPMTASSAALRMNRASTDAPSVAALREAGAVIVGKTNTHEFAFGYVSKPTNNPWDFGRIPGGSSGGSGAAVATSQVLGALGSDTGGSVRIPAALCGVCGLKPRPGKISLEGVVPLSPSLDVVGPLERSVKGITVMWDALTNSATDLSHVPLRIGVPVMDAFPELGPGIGTIFEAAVSDLTETFDVKRDVVVPEFEQFDIPRAAILMPEALDVHKKNGWWPDKAEDYTEELRTYMTFAENYFPDELIRFGKEESKRLVGELLTAFNVVDALVTLTASVIAPTHAEAEEVEDGGLRRPVAMTLGRLVGPVNMAGLAALSVPCGFSQEGLPVGLQIIARDEETALKIGYAYQAVTDWHNRRPALIK